MRRCEQAKQQKLRARGAGCEARAGEHANRRAGETAKARGAGSRARAGEQASLRAGDKATATVEGHWAVVRKPCGTQMGAGRADVRGGMFFYGPNRAAGMTAIPSFLR